MQVDPAVAGDVEGALGEDGPVGDDRAAVGVDLAQPGLEVGVARPGGLEDLDAGLFGAFGDRAGDEPAAAAGRGVGPGDDGRDLVPPGGDQGVQGGYGDLGGACEDELHWGSYLAMSAVSSAPVYGASAGRPTCGATGW